MSYGPAIGDHEAYRRMADAYHEGARYSPEHAAFIPPSADREKGTMSKKKSAPKPIGSIARASLGLPQEPPAAPPPTDQLSPADRSAVREAALEAQLARQQVALLAHEHNRALSAAQAAEHKYQQASAAVIARYSLGPADKVDLATGAITREATG